MDNNAQETVGACDRQRALSAGPKLARSCKHDARSREVAVRRASSTDDGSGVSASNDGAAGVATRRAISPLCRRLRALTPLTELLPRHRRRDRVRSNSYSRVMNRDARHADEFTNRWATCGRYTARDHVAADSNAEVDKRPATDGSIHSDQGWWTVLLISLAVV
jgi:hypothetical protein